MKDIPEDIKKRVELVVKDDMLTVKKVLHQSKPCENCGLEVQNRTENITINRGVNQGVIRRRCAPCGKYYNCLTGEYSISNEGSWKAHVNKVVNSKA
jgi:hypothetical protein